MDSFSAREEDEMVKNITERVLKTVFAKGPHMDKIGMDAIDRTLAMAAGLASAAHRTLDLLVMHTYDHEKEYAALQHARAMLLTALLETNRAEEALRPDEKVEKPDAAK